MRDPADRIQELLEAANRYLERAREAEADRNRWQGLYSADAETLQAIGEEFGFLGGENRIAAVRRVLTEQRDALTEERIEHATTARHRDMWKGQCERQAEELARLRAGGQP